MSIRAASMPAVLLTAGSVAISVSGQGLENGTGSDPSQELSAPPNERNDPAFGHGHVSGQRSGRTRHAAARDRRVRRAAPSSRRTAPNGDQ